MVTHPLLYHLKNKVLFYYFYVMWREQFENLLNVNAISFNLFSLGNINDYTASQLSKDYILMIVRIFKLNNFHFWSHVGCNLSAFENVSLAILQACIFFLVLLV